ncbi:MAG TPA: serine--tRNA ligase [Acidimicrobiales bacterium]|nr:serine--tRNA ligase [Acidimicrobiales bacterium]
MIDIQLVRRDPDGVRAALARRGEASDLDRLIASDSRWRSVTGRRDELRARIKSLSRDVADARRAQDTGRAEELAAQSRALGQEEKPLDAEVAALEAERRELLLEIPNLPDPEVPDGTGPADNVVRRWWSPGPGGEGRPEPPDPSAYGPHQRVPHWEIGAQLGLLDLERGSKLSGSMFPVYRGMGARLLRAMESLALDRHADAFEEIRPPTLVRTDTMVGSGQLPKFADDAYNIEGDDLWAIPTSEVPLASLYRGEILAEDDLPVRLTAATACFRREAGAAGRDTRGVLRVHEFDKVELFAYTTPGQAGEMFDEIVGRAEGLLRELGLAYRVVDLCAGDLGQASARTYDLEVYAPGTDQWLEVSSVSWCTDYQARRANIRYRPADGGGPAFVHTLNGSGLAWGRPWAALIETGRQPDGSVRLPESLRPYLGGVAEIPVP